MKRYYYHFEERNKKGETKSSLIIKAKDVIEAMSLLQKKLKNRKLSFDNYGDISGRVGLMIRRISKVEKDYLLSAAFTKTKYVKNTNLIKSNLKAYAVIENGIDWGDRDRQVDTVYAKNEKKATKLANKKGGYEIGKRGFYRLSKIKNEYK